MAEIKIDADKFYYFDVRGSRHMTQGSTLLKFPASKLCEIALASVNDPIEIDLDPICFETMLNLMRYGDPIYLKGLSRRNLLSIREDVDFYGLGDFDEMVIAEIKRREHEPGSIRTIMSNHLDHLLKIQRPTIVVGLQTMRWLQHDETAPPELSIECMNPRPKVCDFMKLLSLQPYDFRVFPSDFQGSPFEDDRMPVHLSLYEPGSIEPKLVMNHTCNDCTDFFSRVLEFLNGVYNILKHPPGTAASKLILPYTLKTVQN